jgi:DNA-binding HxlR family transcriptional regulator
MATTANEVRPRAGRSAAEQDATTDSITSTSAEAAPPRMALLTDEFVRDILDVLGDGPKRGRDLAAACDASRSTIYRRINRLEDVGLVTAETTVDPDGHHCKEFRLVRDQLTVSVEDGSITVRARPSSTGSGP